MAKKRVGNPLDNLTTFNPEIIEAVRLSGNTKIATEPVSPLGPAPLVSSDPVPTSSLEMLLQEANRQIEQLQAKLEAEQTGRRELEKRLYELEAQVKIAGRSEDELEIERRSRSTLERQIAAMEVEIRDGQRLRTLLDEERAARLELERKTATLEVLSERARDLAVQLAEERSVRVALERDKATLDVEMQHAKKMETFLAEERRARMNAQSRAATAEAKLSRLEGELAQGGGSRGESSLLNRLRGR